MGDVIDELFAENALIKRRSESYRSECATLKDKLTEAERSRRQLCVRHEQTLRRERAAAASAASAAVERIALLEAQVKAAAERDEAAQVVLHERDEALTRVATYQDAAVRACADVVMLRKLNARFVDEIQRLNAALRVACEEGDIMERRYDSVLAALGFAEAKLNNK